MATERRTAIALRHVAFEDLGLLAPLLDAAGWQVSYRDAPLDPLRDPALDDAGLLIVLGGPVGVYQTDDYGFLTDEIALVERRLARRRPTLGICLGCQIMAKALGAAVFPGARKQIGWGAVRLTEEGLASCLKPLAAPQARVLHWHGDTFDLPDGAVRLAADAVYDNQAFACGDNALALQFHVEADPARPESWYVGHAAELAGAGVSVRELRAATAAAAAQARAQAHAIFTDWLGRVG